MINRAAVAVPTLVMVEGASQPFFHNGTQTLARILPQARHLCLKDRDHGPADESLAPALIEFFKI